MTAVEPTNDLDTLLEWRGRSTTAVDTISPEWCMRLQHTLDGTDELGDGDVLPPLWHFTTHLGSAPLRELGRDGHPKRGGFLPPVALPRRMWAGGRFTFAGDIRLGDEVTKVSTIDDVAMKSGRTGPLCFVTVRHELAVDGVVRLTEEQDLVYREDPAPDAPKPEPKPAPPTSEWNRAIEPSEVMLFRYSALTFNGHRIHYDRTYATEVEGYDGLVVHGPLTATLLADLATTEGGTLATFSFRGLSPLFAPEPFTLHGNRTEDGADLWARTPAGHVGMQAKATYR